MINTKDRFCCKMCQMRLFLLYRNSFQHLNNLFFPCTYINTIIFSIIKKKNVKSILSFSNPLSQSLFFLAHNEYNGINIQSWDHFKKIERVYHCISDSNPFTLYPDVVYLCWTTKPTIFLKHWSLRNIDTRELIQFVYI